MGLNLIVMCTAIGALVGTSVGILLMSRKARLANSGTELAALNEKLETTESSLAAVTASVEDLCKQIAMRDQTIRQYEQDLKKKQERIDELVTVEFSLAPATASAKDLRKQIAMRDQIIRQYEQDLKKKQEQIDMILTEADKEKWRRARAEEKVREHRRELESQLEEQRKLGTQKSSEIAALEAQHDEQKRQVHLLTEQVESLRAVSAAYDRFREEESRHRSSLEEQLKLELERTHQQIAELESEKSQTDTRLQEVRQSAAKGMELLLMALENLAHVVKRVPEDDFNGNYHHVVQVSASLKEADDVAENVQSV